MTHLIHFLGNISWACQSSRGPTLNPPRRSLPVCLPPGSSWSILVHLGLRVLTFSSSRDFTINTLAMQLNHNNFGQIKDFYQGREALILKQIAVLHPASFEDDPTRLFRAVRFEQRYGFQIGMYPLVHSIQPPPVREPSLASFSLAVYLCKSCKGTFWMYFWFLWVFVFCSWRFFW